MPAANCPYCGSDTEVAMLLPGIPLRCAECGNSFATPSGLRTIESDYGQPSPQVIVVSHSSPARHQPRLQAGGWFSRAFATTSGVLMAFLAFILCMMIMAGFAMALLITYGQAQQSNQPPAKVSRSR